jgi:hypothetical protein
MYRAAECQIALGDLDGAIQSCADGLVRHPGIAELPWLAAWASHQKGEYRRAIAWARMSCAIGSVEGVGDSFQRVGFSNPRGRFEGPYDVLRFALRELGEDEAADAADLLFEEALALRGENPEQISCTATEPAGKHARRLVHGSSFSTDIWRSRNTTRTRLFGPASRSRQP